jgi:hypothetical protein
MPLLAKGQANAKAQRREGTQRRLFENTALSGSVADSASGIAFLRGPLRLCGEVLNLTFLRLRDRSNGLCRYACLEGEGERIFVITLVFMRLPCPEPARRSTHRILGV